MDFRLPVAYYNIGVSSIEKLDPENGGVAVGISILSSLEAEICLGGNFTPRAKYNGWEKRLRYEG